MWMLSGTVPSVYRSSTRKLEHHHCSYAKNVLVINIWASGCIRSVARIITQASDDGWVYNNRSGAHTQTHNRQRWLHMKGLEVSLSKSFKEIITKPLHQIVTKTTRTIYLKAFQLLLSFSHSDHHKLQILVRHSQQRATDNQSIRQSSFIVMFPVEGIHTPSRSCKENPCEFRRQRACWVK